MDTDQVGAPRRAESGLGELVQVAAALDGASMAAVVMLSAAGLELAATHGLPPLPGVSALVEELASCDQVMLLEDLMVEPGREADPLVLAGARAVASVPLASSNGDPVGALLIAGGAPIDWPTTVVEALGAIGRQIERSFDRSEEQYHLRDLSVRLVENERVLAHRSRQLARSNRDLERFAYFAAHELQAPLRAVNAFATVLGSSADALDPAAIESVTARVAQEADHMSAQLDGLLALARLVEDGSRAVPVELDGVVDAVQTRLQPELDEVAATLHRDRGLPTVLGDSAALETILMNLCSNAVRYRDRSRPLQLSVSARSEGTDVSIEVRDNGIGIAREALDRVFEAFQRADSSVPGAGIGLTLSRRLAEHMGGNIEVASVAGEWTAFTLTLPAP